MKNCRPPRITLRDLHNSSDYAKAESNKCLILIQNNSCFKTWLSPSVQCSIYSSNEYPLLPVELYFCCSCYAFNGSAMFSSQNVFPLFTQLSLHYFIPWASQLHAFLWRYPDTIDVILPDIANVFEPIWNGDIHGVYSRENLRWDKGKWRFDCLKESRKLIDFQVHQANKTVIGTKCILLGDLLILFQKLWKRKLP